ncbi:MAG: hypothetical protein AAGG51_07550 [Cyanobacteria bacterium P01_G01_bin.54]
MQSPVRIQPQYVQRLLLSVIGLAILILGSILLIDPYGVSPISLQIPGINLAKPARLNIDRQIKPIEVWRKQPKTVFLGTSRIHQSINPRQLENTRFAPAYNAAVPEAYLGENIEYLKFYAEIDKNLEFAFVELFSSSFLGEKEGIKPINKKVVGETYLSLTWSLSAFHATIETLYHNIAKKLEFHYIHDGGYRVYPTVHDSKLVFAGFPVGMWNEFDRIGGRFKLREDSYEAFDELINIASKSGIELIFILTPNHAYFEYFLNTTDSWPVVEEWLIRISKKATVLSFAQPSELNYERVSSDMQYWYDPLHFSLAFGDAIQAAIKQQPLSSTSADFMVRLTPEIVPDIIQKRKNAIEVWAQQNSEFVDEFERARGSRAGGS